MLVKDLSKSLRALPFVLVALAAFVTPSRSALAEEAMVPGFGPPLVAGAFIIPARSSRTTLVASGTCGVQFRSTIPARGVQLWYVRNVLHAYDVTWLMMAVRRHPGRLLV
jgi:hypothetical protein